MADLTATPDELIAVFRELFPREHEIAMLNLMTRKQAERIAELERRDGPPMGGDVTVQGSSSRPHSSQP
jgi:hypothetical protein